MLYTKGIQSIWVQLGHRVQGLQQAGGAAGERPGDKESDPFLAAYKWDTSFPNNQAALSTVTYV